MTANERREWLVELLCLRRRDTVGKLAAELDVNERTIRQDIEALTLSYPIETVCGRYGGGVSMADCYSQTCKLALSLQGEDREEMDGILAQFGS